MKSKRLFTGIGLFACMLAGTLRADDALNTELYNATLQDTTTVMGLIKKGADVNGKDSSGQTPLYRAVQMGDKEMVAFLLAHGADVSIKDNNGYTALYVGSTQDTEKVKALLAKGADVNVKNAIGQTPLHEAAELGTKEMLDLLLANGADIKAKDKDGATPLHEAARYENKVALQELVDHGAELEAKTNSGATPLYAAVSANRDGAVELLLSLGADPNAKDMWGQTPLDLTVRFKDNSAAQAKIVKMLQAAQTRKVQKTAGPSHVGLKTMLAEFKGHSDNESLRKAIVDTVGTLKPAPAIPAEAVEADGRAQYLFKNAKSDDDYLQVAKQYLQAIEAAPWVPKYYYNLCVVLDKTVYAQQAVHAGKLFLEAAPNAPEEDVSRIRAIVAGQQFALQKNMAQMKARTSYLSHIGMDEMYRLGGIEQTVLGKDVTLKMVVNWQASPPQYQLLASCFDNNDVYTTAYNLVSTDESVAMCHSATAMHLIIKPAGNGFAELSDYSGSGGIRATFDQLFAMRSKAMETSPLFGVDDSTTHTRRTYVALSQGGSDQIHSGFAFHGCDCNGGLLRKDPRALPDDFRTRQDQVQTKFGQYVPVFGESLEDLSACAQSFASATGYADWGKDEK